MNDSDNSVFSVKIELNVWTILSFIVVFLFPIFKSSQIQFDCDAKRVI